MGDSCARPRGLTVIFKGTDACDGGCRFCSVGEARAHCISAPDFERLAQRLEEAVGSGRVDHLDFTFHGGEPTLLGAAFVDQACARLRELGVEVRISMQTNLLHVSDDLLEVAHRNGIRLGSSVDPLGHDRLTRDGRPAFPVWLHGYERAITAGFTVGAIFVVTRAALGNAARVYRAAESLAALGAPPGLQLNPVYPQGRATGDPGQRVTAEEYGRFLVDVWRCWEASGRSIELAPIEAFVAHLECPERAVALPCAYQGECGPHVGVDFDLRVAGCGRRLDSGAFVGNLRDTPVLDLLDGSAERATVAGRVAALARGPCAGCRFFSMCHGGCPDDAALGGAGIADRTPWCAGYRLLFETLERELAAPRRSRRLVPAPRPVPTVLFASRDPAEADPPLAPGERLVRWVLPAPGAGTLRHDGNLAAVLGSAAARIVVAVPNARVRALTLWRDVLRDARVSVLLKGGGEDLGPALNVLNALGAPVLLDLAAIAAEPGGAERLEAAAERFFHDPLWRVPVEPFASQLRRAADRVHAPFEERHGLPRGSTRVVLGRGGAEVLAEVAPRLAEEVSSPGRMWLAEGAGCAACPELRTCGGAQAATPDAACALVPLVAAVAREGERIGALVEEAAPT